MQPKTALTAAFAALAPAACAVPPDLGRPGDPPMDQCGASRNQALVGRAPGADFWPEAGAVRVIDHDTMITMDFVAERLNVWLDADGRIERITCG